jgi:pyrimidine-nucleoside phosphorylase
MPPATLTPTFNPVAFIDAKRRGHAHTQADINAWVAGAVAGDIKDYQVAAWLMAVCLQGLTLDETTWLTQAFVASGDTLSWAGMEAPVVDKHSTGGVGDKATLIVVPLLAAAGLKVAKLSGRGLGFTGGTIDKLESIPDLQTQLSNEAFSKQLHEVGAVISCASPTLAPADSLFYALRDVTATVDHLSLIAASVVSKKLAVGADAVVLDIKFGRGAFMATQAEAQALADLCLAVAERCGKPMVATLSSMEQPLGYAIGHSLEVLEAVATLKGQGPADVEALCLHLGAQLLCQVTPELPFTEAKHRLNALLHDGQAYAKFEAMVKAQGGDVEALTEPSLLPQPQRVCFVPSPQEGYVAGIDPLALAKVVTLLGGGRLRKGDPVDLGVGLLLHKKCGDAVALGETLLELHGDADHTTEAQALVLGAFTFSSTPVTPLPLLV